MRRKDRFQQIANDAVREAQKRSLAKGVANVYSKNGVIYFQLPDGSITMNNPFKKVCNDQKSKRV